LKNKHLWKPTKFVITGNGCRASRDPSQVWIGSRFVGDIAARVCEKVIKEHARGLLLDLGCGHVPLYEVYRNYVSNNVCIDWAGTWHKSPYLDYECDLNSLLPLPDGTFDTILLTDVLEHISNPRLLWNEMSRVLKPGGKIVCAVPFYYWLHEQPHDYFRYTEYALKMFCENNALAVLSLEPYGGAAEVLIDVVAKQLGFPTCCLGCISRLARLLCVRVWAGGYSRKPPANSH